MNQLVVATADRPISTATVSRTNRTNVLFIPNPGQADMPTVTAWAMPAMRTLTVMVPMMARTTVPDSTIRTRPTSDSDGARR